MLNGIIIPLSAPPLTFWAFLLFLSKCFLPKKGNTTGWSSWIQSLGLIWAVHYYQSFEHQALWSEEIWGNSQVRSRDYRGWLVSKRWVMNRSTVFAGNTKPGLVYASNYANKSRKTSGHTSPDCYWCHGALFGHQKDRGDFITAILIHRVMGYRELKGFESMCEMCFPRTTGALHEQETTCCVASCLWLSCTNFTA